MHYFAVWKEILCRKSARKLQGKIIKTTLGGLIVVVTDEVMPIIRDPSGLIWWCPVSCPISWLTSTSAFTRDHAEVVTKIVDNKE
jgi:hypothetical protein